MRYGSTGYQKASQWNKRTMGMVNGEKRESVWVYNYGDIALFSVDQFVDAPVFPTAVWEISSNDDWDLFCFEFFVCDF